MRKTLKIAVREYTEAVRSKAFVIGIVLVPVLMSGSLLAMLLLKDQVDTTDKRIAVLDHTGSIAPALVQAARKRNASETHDAESGTKIRPAYVLEIVKPAGDAEAQRLELSDRIRARDLFAFVEIGPDVVSPGDDPDAARISYHAENTLLDDVRGWIARTVNDRIRNLRMAGANVDEQLVDGIVRWVPVERLGLLTVDTSTGEIRDAERANEALAVGVPMGMVMLMFMLLMIGALPLAHSSLEEKTQRIAEVLLGSARPSEIMAGKLAGNLAASLTAALVYVGGAIVVCTRLGWTEHVPWNVLPWFVVYAVAAVVMFGAICAALGAACNDAKEIQSLMPVFILPMFIPMFVLVPVLKEPASSFSTGMSLVPPFAPTLMLLRQSIPGGVPAWQPWTALVGMALFTAFCVWAGGRVFRVGLLMQGKPPKARDLVRWAVHG